MALAACASTPAQPHPTTPPAHQTSAPAHAGADKTPPPESGTTAPAPQPNPHATAPAPSPAKLDTAPSENPPDSAIKRALDRFVSQPRFAAATWGIRVISLDTGKVLYAHNADKLFIPASNTKLYTTALALHRLGADDRITTSLYATRAPSGQVLHGDLVLYGRGDPSLGSGSDHRSPTAWADALAKDLAAAGVKHVDGDLIADATHFSGPRVGAGWEANDLQSWFAASPTALAVKGNAFSVRVGMHDGQCCSVRTRPSKLGLKVVNLTQNIPSSARNDLGLYRPAGSDTLYVYGGLHRHSAPRSFRLSAPDPARMAGRMLADALARHGITLRGHVVSRYWPYPDTLSDAPGTVAIGQVQSEPLSAMVHHTLKHSDNLYAQTLLLDVGVTQQAMGRCSDLRRLPHTSEGWGLCALRELLGTAGIGPDQAMFEEGSGLSRKDLVSPFATTQLLHWAARQPFYQVYHDAMPTAGVDGTLRYRLRHTRAAGNMHAKTGTLRFSYALSGYVTDASGQHLAFSIMLDRYRRRLSPHGRPIGPSVHHDIDHIARVITDQ
nr:D-alanyl-D-alanine carboxypeptidase/D-alanyl-D-alanine-endopeptidase [Oleiagrimonas sp. C23AA]